MTIQKKTALTRRPRATAQTDTSTDTSSLAPNTPPPSTEGLEPEVTLSARLVSLLVADIAPSPDNTRLFNLKKDKEEKISLEELAASIQALGLQQPIRVRPASEGNQRWILIMGERRLRAVRDILKWTHIPAIVDDAISSDDAAAATVVENLQRRDLHPMDESRGLAILRSQGLTIKEIATRLGRREDFIKERLKLCTLPQAAQDLYRRSTQLTLQTMLTLTDMTHGGKDNKGFPELIMALAEGVDSGSNPRGYLGTVASAQPDVVKRMAHGYSADAGRYNGNYFDSRDSCLHCPFAAYVKGSYEGEGYCLLPSHYQSLHDKGKAAYDAAQQAAAQSRAETGIAATAAHPSWQPEPPKTSGQKAQETRKRHLHQKSAYAPTVAAIERTIDMVPGVDAIDLAVVCAYTLTTHNIAADALTLVSKRHGLTGFPRVQSTPTKEQITQLRTIDPVLLLRGTLEALLLTQAMRERDYDPGRSHGDPVLGLYIPAAAAPSPAGTAEPDAKTTESAA